MYRGTRRDLIVRVTWALFDALIWGAAMFAAGWMRFDFVATQVPVRGVLLFALAAMLGQLVVGGFVGPYAVGHQRGSFEEIIGVARTVAVVGTGLFVWALLTNPALVPRSVPVSAGALALLMMFALRYVVRAVNTHRSATRKGDRRVILFGAGDAGRGLVRSMMHAGDQSFIPVAMLDDDKRMARLRFDGVKVQGTRDDLAKVASKYDATDLVIALPNADATLIRDITDRADALQLHTMVLPPLRQIMDGRPTANDLRDVDLGDLLGRRPIELDQIAIAEQVSGRTVLVTGAGGSIGSELCRQISKFGPGKLLLLDRDESALHATQLTLAGHGLLDGRHAAGRHPRPAGSAPRLPAAPARGRFPCRSAQAPPAVGALSARGMEDQHSGDTQRAGGCGGRWCRHLRQHIDRQGRQPKLRARPQQAGR
jgi:FlaA1/EpsC-like NDP-sugar epimerase